MVTTTPVQGTWSEGTINAQGTNIGGGVFTPTPSGSTTSPTVVSSEGANSSIPGIVSTARNNTASVTGGANNGTGNNRADGTGGTNTTGANGLDINSPNYYSDLLKSETNNQESSLMSDPNYMAGLNLIQSAGTNADAATRASLQALQGQYQSQYASTVASQASTTEGMEQSLNLGGSSRYAPISSAGIMDSKTKYDLATLTDLGNANASNVAKLNQAIADNDFKTAQLINEKMSATRTQAQTLAQGIIDNIQKDREYKMNVEKFQQTKDQNAFDNAFKTEQQTYQEKKDALTMEETKRHNIATETPIGGPTGIQSSAQMSPTGGVDPVSQKAVLDEISAKYGPMTAIAIKGLADYSRLPSDFSVRPLKGTGGMSRADAISLAQQLDPTYTETGAPARQAYMKSLASGPIYQATISANKAINHLISFTDTVGKLGNIDPWSSSNRLSQLVRTPFSSDLQTNLRMSDTEKNGLKDELAKFFKGTGTTDVQSIEDWSKTLSTTANPAQLKGMVQGAITLLAGQIDVMNQSYKNTMGKAPEGAILQPATTEKLSELKNEGYTVDIPGVYYTDPIKYQSASPENATKLAEVRSAHPDLTPAQATQLAQYLQENGQ